MCSVLAFNLFNNLSLFPLKIHIDLGKMFRAFLEYGLTSVLFLWSNSVEQSENGSWFFSMPECLPSLFLSVTEAHTPTLNNAS